MISGLRAAAARRLAISALRAGPCGPVALRNGAAAPVRNAPAGAAPAVKQLARLRLVWRFPWSVGAACMRPATFVLPYRFLVATAFGLCVGAAYMPPANIAAIARCRGACCLSCPVGRAISPAEPIIFLIFIMCGGRERPPYNAAYTVVFPATPA